MSFFSHRAKVVLFLLLLSLASVFAACAFGPVYIPWNKVLAVFMNAPFGCLPEEGVRVVLDNGSSVDLSPAALGRLVLDFRLPRVLLGFASGLSLALAGVVFQSVLQNPLAEPFTLGVSSGAAFGAALAISFGWAAAVKGYGIAVFAFGGAVFALLAVLGISRGKNVLQREGLILAGIIVSAFLAAFISLIKALDESSVSGIVFWILGSLQGRGWPELFLAVPGVILGSVLLFPVHRELDILTHGDLAAEYLGLRASRWRLFLLFSASLMTAVCVAVTGIISFVGLVVPHVCRMFLGTRHIMLLPVSAFIGGLLLLWADVLARTLLPGGVELPVGALTALLGAPFFCFLLNRRPVFARFGARAARLQQSVSADSKAGRFESNPCASGSGVLRSKQGLSFSAAGKVLDWENVSVCYLGADRAAVHSVSLSLSAGEFVALLGPNGSGKSTLIRCASGEIQPRTGTVRLQGKSLNCYAAKNKARQLAIMPQRAEYLPLLTVFEAVLMGRYAHTTFGKVYSRHDLDIVWQSLEETGSASLAERFLPTLSGGELQRVFLARALAQQVSVLLLDEVLAGLDPFYQIAILDTLRRQVAQTGLTVLVAAHDVNLAAQYCHRLVFLQKGGIYADGPPLKVFNKEVLEHVYDAQVTLASGYGMHVPQAFFTSCGVC